MRIGYQKELATDKQVCPWLGDHFLICSSTFGSQGTQVFLRKEEKGLINPDGDMTAKHNPVFLSCM